MDDIGVFLLLLVIVPFVLFIVRIVLLSWRNVILARQLKRLSEAEARQRGEINVISTVQLDSNNSGGGGGNGASTPKDFDLPPAYDDVMQSYINAKRDLHAAEEGGVIGGSSSSDVGMTASVSTVTIETEVGASVGDLNVTTITTTATTTNRTCPPPPTYESTVHSSVTT